jgi:MFS family permease
MSRLTQTQPAAAVRARLLSVPLAATFLAEFTSLTSFFLLLSVMPMLAAAAGAGSSDAGLITGSLLLGTVAAEAAAAPVISRFGYRIVLAAGAVLLGAPALAMLAPEPQAVMVSVSVVRGFGFGLSGVATGALTAKLLPPGRRGEGLGLLGIVSGIPAVVALPTGIWLAGHHLAAAAAAMAATAGLLPLAAVRWLPGGREARHTDRARPMPGARSSRWMAGATLRLPLIFAAATVAAGVPPGGSTASGCGTGGSGT